MSGSGNIVFGGVLNSHPGGLFGFGVEAKRLANMESTGLYDVFHGSRRELQKKGEEMLKEWGELCDREKRVCKVLCQVVVAGQHVGACVVTDDLSRLDWEEVGDRLGRIVDERHRVEGDCVGAAVEG